MNNIRKMGALMGAGAVIFSLAGCADKNNNGQPDSLSNATQENLQDTANVASGAVDGAANAASAAGGAMSNAASSAGGAISNAASSAGGAIVNAGEAATMTPAIKTAIGANAGLKGTTINVDTLGSKDTIALRGTVKTQAQKTLAESIAKSKAPGYKIANQLKVG